MQDPCDPFLNAICMFVSFPRFRFNFNPNQAEIQVEPSQLNTPPESKP